MPTLASRTACSIPFSAGGDLAARGGDGGEGGGDEHGVDGDDGEAGVEQVQRRCASEPRRNI